MSQINSQNPTEIPAKHRGGFAAWKNTIRGRLTLLNLGLIGLLFVGAVLAQYLLLGNFLIGQQASTMRTAAKLGAERQFSNPEGRAPVQGRIFSRIASDLTSKDTLALMVASNGDIFAPSSGVTQTNPGPENAVPVDSHLSDNASIPITLTDSSGITTTYTFPALPVDLVQRALQGETDLTYTAQISGDEWGKVLVCLVPVRAVVGNNGPGQGRGGGNQNNNNNATERLVGVAIVASPTEPNERTLGGLLLINLILFSGLIIIIGVISPLIARSSLRPLRRMIDTTRQIAGGDLTQRVQIPDSLSRQDEVGQLALSFNQMVAQLERLFQTQRQLVADASHELRTPLTAVKGSLEVLMMGGVASDPQAANDLMKSMHQEVARLTRLVNDLLTLSRVDRGERLMLQPLKLLPLLQEVKASSEILSLQSGKEVQIELKNDIAAGVEPQVMADSDRLKQVLFNLVDNALKFSPIGGRITLELLSASPQPQVKQTCYGIVVRDEGDGISPDDLTHIFDRFYRGDTSRSRQSGGSGLGLAIARALIENQHGVIRAESTLGKGSSFFIYLPVLKEEKSKAVVQQAVG